MARGAAAPQAPAGGVRGCTSRTGADRERSMAKLVGPALVPAAELAMVPGDDAGRVEAKADALGRLLGDDLPALLRRHGSPCGGGIADAEAQADLGRGVELADQLHVALHHGAAQLDVEVARLHLERGPGDRKSV